MSSYILPSKRIFESVFNELVFYIENDCAEKELIFGNSKYSWWERFVYDHLPNRFSTEFRKRLGMSYINNVMGLESDEYVYIRETYRRVRELYLWYVREYPFITSPWKDEPPPFRYVDSDGNDTNELFTEGRMNKIHSDYIEFLNNTAAAEENQKNLLENKLQELLKLRYVL
jgi:hypothetical protein